MDYRVLKTEIALPGYAGMSDGEIAEALNTVDVPVFVDVDPADWYDTLLASGEWGRIELFSRLAPTGTLAVPTTQDGNVARLLTFVRAVTFDRPIRASRQAVRDVFGTITTAMVSGGFISSSTRAALVAFAQTNISRAAQIGLPPVTPGDIATARATIA